MGLRSAVAHPFRRSAAFLAGYLFQAVPQRPHAPPGFILFIHGTLGLVPVLALPFLPLTVEALLAFLLMNGIGIIGSEVADHRYYSHAAFRTSRGFEAFLALCSGLVLQDSALHWATDHRLHHRYSDQSGAAGDRDPHNAAKGFWYSLYGWLLTSSPDRDDLQTKRRVGRRCIAGRAVRIFHYLPFILVLLAAILAGLYALGGLSAVAWGLVGLIAVPLLDMGLVNSVGHGHGPAFLHSRAYATGDLSTNVALLAFLGSGVGWHNNHHAFPYSARAGLEWWQLDKAWLFIRLAALLGLVWDVKLPTRERRDRFPKPAALAGPVSVASDGSCQDRLPV